MSPSAMIFRALLLLVPALVAGFGGFLAYYFRHSRFLARSAQLGTAFTLLGLGVTSYFSELPAVFWVLQLLLATPSCIRFAADIPWIANLAAAVMAPRRWGLALLMVSPILLACAVWQLDRITTVDGYALDEHPQLPLGVHELSEAAYTDHGRHIHLFELKSESKESFNVSGNDGLLESGSPMPYQAIRLTEPDSASNCAGWVFTGGHHLMQCCDVNLILEDNGYQHATEPRVGDLVIYRNNNDVITHVGSVAMLVNGTQPLVESKWGYQGAFLHLPKASPFGSNWTFYRTGRSNHHLLLTSPPSAEAGAHSSEASP